MTPIATRLRLLLLLLAALLLPALSHPAHAAWPQDAAAGAPVCRMNSDQRMPVAVSDEAGGAIVIWEDHRNGANYGLYAQRLGPQGDFLWTPNGVLVNTSTNDQGLVVAIPDGEHGVILCWEDTRSGAKDIFAQRLDATGARSWNSGGVPVCTSSGNQMFPRLASDGQGGALVAWQDGRYGNFDIFAQRLNSSGTALWRPNGAVVCSLATAQSAPDITTDMLGGAFVVWTDARAGNSDVYAQRLLENGSPNWTVNGLVLCDAALEQGGARIVSDGEYGGLVAWSDSRNGNADIYAQALYQGGGGLWQTNGVPVCTAASTQMYLQVAGNGRGGMFLAWSDYRGGSNYDLYAQYLGAGGNVVWPLNGVQVSSATGDQNVNGIVLDGLGGVIVVWSDTRLGTYEQDVYAQHVDETGSQSWGWNGLRVGGGPADQVFGAVVADGTGGAIVAYEDDLPDWMGDISAQYVERFGHLGNPAPAITRVCDVPNDQGGKVQVEWTASYLDTFPALDIAQYTVWRRVPNPAPAQVAGFARAAAGARVARTADGRLLRTGAQGAQAVYWEQVGSQSARGLPGYSFVTATTSDSLPGSNPYSSFMVMAEESSGVPFWQSAPDSGYSVDNLAPPVPAPFTGTYADGTTYLQWPQSPASDFAEFRLHRGQEPGFKPAPDNFVVAQASAGYVDAAGAPYFYRLCAVDIHGNLSPYAFLQPSGTTDVPGAALPRELALSAPAPNPLRGSCTMRLSLPRDAQVSLAVYDQQGRCVRSLVVGALPAGEHVVVWDGRDEGGRRVPSGIYFVRCAVESRVLTRRIAAVR